MAKQIIAIDVADKTDYTVFASICGNCRHILNCEAHEYDFDVVVYKKCPFCGETFTKHLITEE